jgi:endoglucanase
MVFLNKINEQSKMKIIKRRSKMKRFFAILILLAIAFSGYSYNWGEALQKAVYFYECQQAGPLMAGNRVEWRGNATMNDGVTGGWYDAGDHVKFNLPMAYAASMLAWGEYEYKSALQASGQLSYYEANLKFVLDYLASCWDGSTYAYQVGDGNNDHTWWGPVECIEKETQAGNRPVARSSTAGCVMAHTAASLALGNILFGNAAYLTKAKQLFTKVDTDRSDAGYTAANNFYTSWSGPIDELLWAACWLYIATNDASYLTKAESYVPLLKLQQQTTEIEYQWGHCWDDVHYGAMLLLLRLTNNATYRHFVELHLDWWVAGAKGKTPKGLSWLDSWGSLRYASAASFLAFVYTDWSGADTARAASYKTWATSQMNYIAGDNERSGSYVVGYGTNAPKRPHHRTSHGSWVDSQTVPAYHRHILYGALVGGPDQSGGYTDDISNYTTNEVACDYNAGFAASSIKMYSLSGGSPVAGFPAPETKEDEFFCEAKAGGVQTSMYDLTIFCNNRSGWPARMIKNLAFRYYVDLSEVSNPTGVTAATNYIEFPATITGPTLASGSIYYFNVAFTDGTSIYPGGQSEYAAEVQLRLTAPSGSSFNAANDPSYQGVTSTQAITPNIPVYDGTTLIYGNDPFAGTPQATTVPTPEVTPVTTPIPNPIPLTITISAPAGVTGTVVASPGQTVSGPNGTSVVIQYPQPATVTFTASSTGGAFSSWSGALTGSSNPATLTVDRVLTVTANFTATATPAPGLLGDVNTSGTVDIVDALLTAQYYVGLNPAGFVEANADVNCSGTIDIVDALRIAQYYVGLLASLSC